MYYTKKAKNAEHLGLRFSISFFRMKDELGANVQVFLYLSTIFTLFNKKQDAIKQEFMCI